MIYRHARLSFLKSDEGRKTPLTSGYRSIIRIVDVPAEFGVQIAPLEAASVDPGGETEVRLSLWAVDEAEANQLLPPGQRFELLEGQRIVGRESITE